MRKISKGCSCCVVFTDISLLVHRLRSFPSDRTAVAFAAAVFLALYMNAKLKVFADYGSWFWKQMLVITPVMGACIIGGGLVVDKALLPVSLTSWLDPLTGRCSTIISLTLFLERYLAQ